MLIDTHCHLTTMTSEELQAALDSAAQCGVTRAICIGASVGTESARESVQIAETYPNVWASVGIHPHDAGKELDFQEIESLATHERVVAIGETGLDYFRDWSPVDAQQQLFRRTIALAKKVKKPLIIHCREAMADTLKILHDEQAADVGGVFHCYSGDEITGRELRTINFLVSFPGSLTFKRSEELRRIANEIPLDQIMLETDAPYMAPEPFRGQKSEPKHVYQIALKLAEVRGLPLEEIARQTSENSKRLFGV